MLNEKIKTKLIEENEWLPKALEMLHLRLIDRGFNVLDQWLGFYDIYTLYYVPNKWINNHGQKEILDHGTLEIHNKEKVFNPYKYCNGDGYEYELLTTMNIKEKHWNIIQKYIRFNDYKLYDKKISFDNPYPEQPIEYNDGSDVPISAYYE